MIRRPSRPSPSDRERDTEAIPAMAATPSAMQARNTPNPDSPPRNSRSARRRMRGLRRGALAVGGSEPCMVFTDSYTRTVPSPLCGGGWPPEGVGRGEPGFRKGRSAR